ncbi:MAG: hypothetical protein QW667_00965 [Candidatus Bathyarchaeia archaeon]
MPKTQTIENKISHIIDKVLTQIFGEEATSLIYRYLEKNYSLKKDEIAEKIDLFAKGLEDFLNSGAYVIEKKILEDIYSNYGLIKRVKPEDDFTRQMKLILQRA